MKTLPFFLTLCLLAASAPAQTSKPGASPAGSNPPLPTGPLLRGVGDFAQWEITYSYSDERSLKDRGAASSHPDPTLNARARKTVITKTGRIVHEQQTDIGDHVSDLWFDGPTQYYQTDPKSAWFQLQPGSLLNTGMAATYRALPASGYLEMDWINEVNYVRTISYGQRNCLIFVPGGPRGLDLSDSAQRQKRMEEAGTIAFVAEDTRLPIAVKAGGVLRTFVFAVPPTDIQKFPADLAEQIRKGSEGRARLEMPAPRPY